MSHGSVLGPLLFVLYTNDVIDIIKRHELIKQYYADNTQLYFYCMPEELDALAGAIGACTEELSAWMRSNRLKLNCEKTECMWLSAKQRRKTLSAPAPHVGGAEATARRATITITGCSTDSFCIRWCHAAWTTATR